MGSAPILLSSAASAQLFLVNLYVYVGVLSSSSSRVSRGRLFLVSNRGIILCVRACVNVLIESVHKICRQNLSKIKLCDWPNKLDATSWQVLNTTESVGMDIF